MATTAELARPGVEILQTFTAASATYTKPTLAPVVVGPAFEVINVLTSDGTINSKAKYGSYLQLGKTITSLKFPDPRGNIDELEIVQSSVRPFMLTGGKLSELPMNPGEGFLCESHVASKPAFRRTGNSFAVQGKTLVIAIDQPKIADYTADVTITFPGSSPLTAQQVCDAVNVAFPPQEVATVLYTNDGNVSGFQIASPRYGALASVTIRAGGSANSALGLGYVDAAAASERIEGAGYRAQDQGNNTTESSWIEMHPGAYLVNGAAHSLVSGKTGWINVDTGVFNDVAIPAQATFGSSTIIPIQVGDQIYADGVRVSGEITRVEERRFKIGTVNAALSTADAQGNYTYKVYDAGSVGLVTDPTEPFSPTYVWFKATGLLSTGTPTKAYLTGNSPASAATAAYVESTVAPSGPFVLDGLTLHVVLTVNGVATDNSFAFPSGTYADMTAVASVIDIPGVTASDNLGALRLSSTATGRLVSITVMPDGEANSALNFSIVSPTTDTGSDPELSNLSGTELTFSLDQSDHVYSATFSSNSVVEAAESINSLVGAPVATLTNDALPYLVITSTLAGVASQVKIEGAPAAAPIIGFSTNETASNGAGRPLPDAYLDLEGSLVLGPQMIRDPVTGRPQDFTTSQGTIYIQFRALRKDVSASAADAGMVNIPDIATLQAVLDPITEENPGGLGVYFCMLNCPSFEVKYLGIDDVSAVAPEGTELAWARAANFLEAEEVYAIAPLTKNEVVHSLFMAHVGAMSDPEQGGERIVLLNKAMPTRKNPKVAASGISANSTATANQLLVDVAVQSGLVSCGINPAQPITLAMGAYVELTWGGLFYRYSVSSVSGGLLNLRTSISAADNADLFYTTTALPAGIIDASWSLKVRGESLYIPGSSMLDYSLVADTISEANGSIGNRRVFQVFPDFALATVGGVEKTLPGYYYCAAIAGQVAGLAPQQGLTNYPLVGFTGVVGTERFSRKQLNKMAGGGTYILMQEVQGGSVFSRHQLSTDTSSVETRELSITKVVDFTAKFLRTGLRRFIGRQNINSVFLDTLGTTIQGMLQFLVDGGVLNGAYLNNIIQSEQSPDTVLIDVTLDVPFPCNYIRLTLKV